MYHKRSSRVIGQLEAQWTDTVVKKRKALIGKSGGGKSSKDEPKSRRTESLSSKHVTDSSRADLEVANIALQTVSAALDIRVNDLARANNDLKNLFESTQIATVFVDKRFRVRGFTPAATDIFRLRDNDIGSPLSHRRLLAAYPELNDDIREALKQLIMAERRVSFGDAHYLARVHPYREANDAIAGAVINFLDVTSTVRAEEALRESEARLRVLLAELQHRVRNTLAVVKSIARRTAQSTDTAEEMADHLVGRIDAFARVQSAVTRNPDAGIDLASLIADELLAHAVHEGETVTMKGPTILLKPKAAESISLAIHELTTNAVKHGALRDKDGRIAVKWRISGSDGEKRLLFDWNEDSPNNNIDHEPQEGFGMELLERILPHDLGAKTNFGLRPHGVRFALELPYDHLLTKDGGGSSAAS